MEVKRPLPHVNYEDEPFWKAAKEHRLILPKCKSCGDVWFPPYASCTKCASSDKEWVTASGRGKIWGYIDMHQPYLPFFRKDLPYNVVLVRLEEGAYLYTNVVGAKYEDLRIDQPVEVVFDDVDEKFALPKFKLAG